MKRNLYLTALLLFFFATAASAQVEKRLQNYFQIAGGLFSESGSGANDVFPGAMLRFSYGLDIKLNNDWSIMPGAGIRAQIAEINHLGWVGGDPDMMEMADFYCQARYHQEADVGLSNSMKQYPELKRTGSIRFQYIALTCGWHF